jgi:hypothetical protein
MSAPASAPYYALVGLIENELELARQARYEDLAEAAAIRAEFAKTLPDTPPAAAREPLQRAMQLHQELTSEALRGHEALLTAVSEIGRASRAAHGYTPLRAREHLSTSA